LDFQARTGPARRAGRCSPWLSSISRSCRFGRQAWRTSHSSQFSSTARISQSKRIELEGDYEERFENAGGFKLGGWPSLVQGKLADFSYVFQIDSTEKGGWSWAHGGVGFFGRGTGAERGSEWAFTWQSL
jgi:hypothetical protein